MTHRRPLLTAALALLAAAALASSAHAAGQYSTYLCKLPNGDPAPAGVWSGGGSVTDSCASGGDLTLRMGFGAGVGASVATALTAPADLSIQRAELWRDFNMPVSSNTAQPSLSTSWETRGFGGGGYTGDSATNAYQPPQPPFAANSGIVRTGPLSSVSATITCSFNGSAELNNCTGGGTWSVHKLDLVLADTQSPTVTSPPSGDALDASWHTSASSSLDLAAADQGGGVYRVFLREGSTTVYALADAASAMCRDASSVNATPYEFAGMLPCRTAATAYHPVFDMTPLGDGAHTVAVGIEDAAGNEVIPAGFGAKTVRVNLAGGSLGDAGQPCAGGGTFDASGTCVPPSGGGTGGGGGGGVPVPSGPPPAVTPSGPSSTVPTDRPVARISNGRNGTASAQITARFLETDERTLRAGYGRAIPVTGRLTTTGGTPIAGAALDLLTIARLPGLDSSRVGSVRTDEDGVFRAVVPVGPSRLVRLAYRAFSDDGDYAQRADLDLRVVATARLQVKPRALRNGHTVRFAGSVRGAPKSSRKVVEMQVLQRGRWVTFGTTRLHQGGFNYHYRFTRTFTRASYTFRAIVRADGDWPFETGISNPKRVRVRP